MDPTFQLKPFYIPKVQFAVPSEEYISAQDPRGTKDCLKGNYYYISRECGNFHIFSINHMKRLIKEHGGELKTTRQSHLIYVIGRDPEDRFMELIKGCQQVKHKDLFNKINNSLVKDDHTSHYDSTDDMEID